MVPMQGSILLIHSSVNNILSPDSCLAFNCQLFHRLNTLDQEVKCVGAHGAIYAIHVFVIIKSTSLAKELVTRVAKVSGHLTK